ncbi:CBS domain-containing protein [Evansella vedderi]|uniref:CBS domain-containing protein n=1 Tax=Evansella vedderi TaxID=38282 RepID=A0ABT9ZV38_9BACI|nr:DUF294 nucleotidyltransferase-like domain-containing protein [Evansella vedderi]MDQ0255104.1 CBS domain-containing protein [Evansella vedderi]
MKSFEQLRQYRQQQIVKVSTSHQLLNEFHDELMKGIVHTALKKVESEWGPPPAHFAFFLMGSAGRFEQTIWSDQDHGIIYDGLEEHQDYYLQLGTKITEGLSLCGYELCEGNVMSSNPLWCKSLKKWEEQLIQWLEKATWNSIRNYSIFFDSRVLVGDKSLLLKLKELSFSQIDKSPHLITRFKQNIGNVKKAIGLFGQFLPKQYGEKAGTIHLKETIFFPYVNALRLIAIQEQMTKSSTLSRFHQLPEKFSTLKIYEKDFINLLNNRLCLLLDCKNYDEVHFIKISNLTTKEKHELKRIAKNGYRLYEETKALIDKGV